MLDQIFPDIDFALYHFDPLFHILVKKEKKAPTAKTTTNKVRL